MCYSAMIKAEYRKYVRAYGASLSLQEYHELFVRRIADPRLKLPKAVEAMFQQPENDEEREIKVSINQFNAAQALLLEEALFAQRRRLADAERTLKLKPTKAAAQSQRIATTKIGSLKPPGRPRRWDGWTICDAPSRWTAMRASFRVSTRRFW